MYAQRLEAAVELVRSVQGIIQDESKRSECHVKGEFDFATRVDIEVERCIREGLKARFPDDQFLGEEEDDHPDFSAPVWILDPIDGTTNLIHRFPQYSVSLALAVDGDVELGVVYNPVLDHMFTARRGHGAFLNGAPIRASSRDAAHAIVACGSTIYDRSYTDRHFAILRHLYDRCLDYRRFASAALDCCMVACGRAEIFFECRLSPWDYAAGSLIAQEAGGVAVRLDGYFLDPLRPGGRGVFITNAACREMRQGLPE